MKTEFTCIRCPVGCLLTVSLENGRFLGVTGNACGRGVDYARDESVAPTRMISSTVPLHGGALAVLPVKTAAPIAKGLVAECVKALAGVEVEAPVRMGDVVVADICGSGVDMVATRSVPRK